MRIALIAPPFIPVPPTKYGGTELFIAQLAEGLTALGADVVVYANGESTVGAELRWIYEKSRWPIDGEVYSSLLDTNHTSWAVQDAAKDCDVIHVNNVPALGLSRLVAAPMVYTIHHVHEDALSEFYAWFPNIEYVTISDFQRVRETMPRMRTIHHGIDTGIYKLQCAKQEYLTFLGRIAPMKGTHVAIDVAKKCGIPLKIAGEIQPLYREYWEQEIKPHVDGKFIEYVGEADLAMKNELLGGSLGMLFPILWNEPFGLVMIEAMACGTPVLALRGGSVNEVVAGGMSGYVCSDADEMAERARNLRGFSPAAVRTYVEQNFSVQRMAANYLRLYKEAAERGAFLEMDLPDERAVA